MPVYIKDGSIKNASEKYICAIASISSKEVSYKKEPNLVRVFKEFPDLNVYQLYKQSGKKFKLGTSYRSNNRIALFTHWYAGPGGMFPNDSFNKRKNWFTTSLRELLGMPNLSSLAFDYGNLFNDCNNNFDDYKQILEDFTDTYKLNNGSNVTIIIYKSPETAVHSVESKVKTSAMVRAEAQQKAQQQKTKITVSSTKKINKLVVTKDTKIADFTLTLDDFVHYQVVDKLNSNKSLLELPIHCSWNWLFADTVAKSALNDVQQKLGDTIYEDGTFPEPSNIFNAFNHCHMDNLKVVILGQDPYPTRGHAHGLSFSVQMGVNTPRSLVNIYKAIENDDDVIFTKPNHGCLESWADQGVLLLNSALTVLEGKAGSHLSEWSPFTDRVIQLISEKAKNVVFMLWGRKAQVKKKFINESRHKVLEFNHPSPMIPGNTFGTECKHFSQANKYLKDNDKQEIMWEL